ncbi:MAG: cellulase family glycosylhydrolase, partial [Muribaculaceae bacterium]|nr:cellulase family glycosylhydrolase [Muribaculaceae bacterium]
MLVCLLSATCLDAMSANAEKVADRQSYKIYVDKEGVMRRSDNKEEVSYYGTNYTSPFAYSYRALGYLGKDRKRAIDRDIYHISRLGLNAFRLHLWDAELADSVGNLIGNDHLDLLDYAIAEFEKRGIDIILTAQTNFGNGYPERNIDTGAFTYDFDKCNIHDDPEAQEIQSRYLDQLARHVNPYTGRSYAKDNAIIAMEINNEPCHSGSKEEVTAYINKMAKTLKKAGFDKPILYNVTHNPGVTSAYYDANIDGTTFQWYPTSLV